MSAVRNPIGEKRRKSKLETSKVETWKLTVSQSAQNRSLDPSRIPESKRNSFLRRVQPWRRGAPPKANYRCLKRPSSETTAVAASTAAHPSGLAVAVQRTPAFIRAPIVPERTESAQRQRRRRPPSPVLGAGPGSSFPRKIHTATEIIKKQKN